MKLRGIGDWGLGIWGWGIGPNPQSPIPNPQSPIPNPQLHIFLYYKIYKLNNKIINILNDFTYIYFNLFKIVYENYFPFLSTNFIIPLMPLFLVLSELFLLHGLLSFSMLIITFFLLSFLSLCTFLIELIIKFLNSKNK